MKHLSICTMLLAAMTLAGCSNDKDGTTPDDLQVSVIKGLETLTIEQLTGTAWEESERCQVLADGTLGPNLLQDRLGATPRRIYFGKAEATEFIASSGAVMYYYLNTAYSLNLESREIVFDKSLDLTLNSISDELMVARTVYAVDDMNVSYQSTFRRASAEQLAEWKSTYTNPLK